MKIEDLNQLGAVIKERRLDADLTLDQASELLGVGRRFLIELEKGSRRANVETVIHVLKMYGLNLEITGTVSPQPAYQSAPKKPLKVTMGSAEVGTLSMTGKNGLEFCYSQDALSDDTVPALSVSLPKTLGSFKGTACNFFENLLPEAGQRAALATALGTLETDVYAMLSAAGDCAGAVSLDTGDEPEVPEGYRAVSKKKLRKLIRNSNQSFASFQVEGRALLAGTRPKLPLIRKTDGWLLPEGGSASTHFLKGPALDLANLDIVENEFFCMRLAGAIDLPVARVDYVRLPGPVLLVERYDRTIGPGGEIRKIHQEDLCQATGHPSAAKVEARRGPSYGDMAAIIAQLSSLPVRDLMVLVRWIAFNQLIGNYNAHAKNLSILYGPGGVSIAPFYGLFSTAAMPGASFKQTMRLGGDYRDGPIQRKVWSRVGDELGLPEKAIFRAVDDVSESILTVLDETVAKATKKCGANPVFERIAALVRTRATSGGTV